MAPETWAALTEAGVFALLLLGETKPVSAVLVPRPETNGSSNSRAIGLVGWGKEHVRIRRYEYVRLPRT